jgi:hypothetical protein
MRDRLAKAAALTLSLGVSTLVVAHGGCRGRDDATATPSAEAPTASVATTPATPATPSSVATGASSAATAPSSPAPPGASTAPRPPRYMGASKAAVVFDEDDVKQAGIANAPPSAAQQRPSPPAQQPAPPSLPAGSRP